MLITAAASLVPHPPLHNSLSQTKVDGEINFMDGDNRAATNNVIQLISSKLRAMPNPLQKVPIPTACIRSSFELDALQAVWDHEAQNNPAGGDILLIFPHVRTRDNAQGKTDEPITDKPLAERLEEAVLDSLLAKSIGSANYRFVHNRIQQAARDLVPFGEVRSKLRLRVGRCLWDLCASTPLSECATDRATDSSAFFLAGDYINYTPTKDHLAAAQRDPGAGEHALQIATLVAAATYLQLVSTALRKVRGDPWQEHTISLFGWYAPGAMSSSC